MAFGETTSVATLGEDPACSSAASQLAIMMTTGAPPMADLCEVVVTIEEDWVAGSTQTVTGKTGVTVQFIVPRGLNAGDTISVQTPMPERSASMPPGMPALPTLAASLIDQEQDERARRGSSTQSIVVPSVAVLSSDESAVPAAAPRPRKPRVDTAALTGLRGMAAMQVALGHMTSGSNMRLDLLGGAAMPFFYLLSGFVMTLGYGQTQYARTSICGRRGEPAHDDGRKPMEKGKFWRNRFARLFPVYIVTNAPMLPFVLAGGGAGIGGAAMGPLGSLINGAKNASLAPFYAKQ